MKTKRMIGVMAAMMLAVTPVPVYAAGTAAAQTAQQSTAFGFTYNGNRYEVGMDAEAAYKTLGEPTGSRDVNNCARGAIRKAYSYGNQDVEVFADLNAAETKDVIKTITLMSDKVVTEEGLKVGDTEEQILAIYPNAVKGIGGYNVTKGNTELYISINKLRKKIAYITYQEK